MNTDKNNTQLPQLSVSVSELRIGNFLKFGNNICKVYEINNLNFYIRNEKEDESLKSSLQDIEPITITEEWLLKFGFKKSSHKWFVKEYFTDCEITLEKMIVCYNIKSKRLAIYDSVDDLVDDVVAYPVYTAKITEHVHKLQNLYFALTSSELQIVNLTDR